MQHGKPVKISDVARRAGVSPGTVSNVLNRPDIVSSTKRKAVQNAIEELGYIPNIAGRQLKTGKSTLFGVIVSDITNPYYGTIISGIGDAAEKYNFGTLIASTGYQPQKQDYYLKRMIDSGVAGILVVPESGSSVNFMHIHEKGTPVVLVDTHGENQGVPSVGADDGAGGELAANHLMDIGCRSILVVGGPASLRQAVGRHYGAQNAVAQRDNIELQFRLTKGQFIEEGRKVARDVLNLPPDKRPDGIFATSDMLAIGMLQVLAASKDIRIPEDIAIIGYDDIDFCKSTIIPLSSIRQPAYEMGKEAVRLLMGMDSQKDTQLSTHKTLLPSLSVRASTTAYTRVEN